MQPIQQQQHNGNNKNTDNNNLEQRLGYLIEQSRKNEDDEDSMVNNEIDYIHMRSQSIVNLLYNQQQNVVQQPKNMMITSILQSLPLPSPLPQSNNENVCLKRKREIENE